MGKLILLGAVILVAQFVNAEGLALDEFERVSIVALTNSAQLCSSVFSNIVEVAIESTNEDLKVDGYLMKGVKARHKFFETAEAVCLLEEYIAVSNAVEIADDFTNNWRKWSSRLMLAGCYASGGSFHRSYGVLTNGLSRMSTEGFSGTSNELATALLMKFEMSGVSIPIAYKIMAGMSAAEMGLQTEARRCASQVPLDFAQLIETILNAKDY